MDRHNYNLKGVRGTWRNGYCLWIWTQRAKFKSETRQFAFHFIANDLRKDNSFFLFPT